MTSHGSVSASAAAEGVSPTSSRIAPRNDEVVERDGVTRQTWRGGLRSFYERNFGLFLVFVAQSFGSVVCDLPPPYSPPLDVRESLGFVLAAKNHTKVLTRPME